MSLSNIISSVKKTTKTISDEIEKSENAKMLVSNLSAICSSTILLGLAHKYAPTRYTAAKCLLAMTLQSIACIVTQYAAGKQEKIFDEFKIKELEQKIKQL